MEKGGVWEIKVQEAGERGMEGWIFLPYCPPPPPYGCTSFNWTYLTTSSYLYVPSVNQAASLIVTMSLP